VRFQQDTALQTINLREANYANFAAFGQKTQQSLLRSPRKGAATITGDLHGLLVEAGAKPPRTERGRWGCPACGKCRVSVDFSRSLFNCWTAGCNFHGSARSLAGRLGHRTDSPAWKKQVAAAARRLEVEERAHALRLKAHQAVAERFLVKMHQYQELYPALAQNIDQSDLLEKGLSTYSELLHLNAELFLLDVLPPLHMCEFVGGSEDSRERQIADVVSRDGVCVDGKFYELPPVLSPHSAGMVRGIEMTEESWRPNISPGGAEIGDDESLWNTDKAVKS